MTSARTTRGQRDRVRKRKDTGKWEANYVDVHGKRRWGTHPSKRAAEIWVRRQLAEVDAQRAGLRPSLVVIRTWEDLVGLWEEKKADKRSLPDDLGRIKHHLTPLLSGVKLANLDPGLITRIERAMRAKVKRGVFSASTARKVLVLLGGMLNVARREAWMLSVPHIELPKEPPRDYGWIKDTEQIRAFLNAAREREYPGLFELYTTAIYQGMRLGEMAGLEWPEVDLDLEIIAVIRSHANPYPKNNKLRRVPVATELTPVLRSWEDRCHRRDLVFPNMWGARLRDDSRVFRNIFHECREQAGIACMTFHALRHTFASHYMLNGGDIYRLQKLLGHSSVKVTEMYAHLSPSAFDQDRDRLGKLF